MGITELAELVRRGLAEDERIARAAAVTDAAVWNFPSGTSGYITASGDLEGYPVAYYEADGTADVLSATAAEHAARHDPARVLAEVAAKRALLDEALAWEHYEVDDPWYSCPAAPNAPSEHRTHGCTCGRDERVHAVLQLLATPYQETT